MRNSLSVSAVAAGVPAAFVGFAGLFAIVVHGLMSVGASTDEAASGLMAAAVAIGVCAILLSLRTGMPISVGWSTPGAAFLGTMSAPDGGFAVAVGAFLVTAVLIVLAGLWKRLGEMISAIPLPLASAMLAGVILPLCLAPFEAIAQLPLLGLAVGGAWVIVARWSKLLAVPAAVLVAGILIASTTDFAPSQLETLWSVPTFVTPRLSIAAIVGISIPLFIITMASQNITGIAVLSNFGFRPDASTMFTCIGAFSLVAAPFGCHAVNLTAITAAIYANEDAHPEPARRHWSAVVAGVVYVVFDLTAAMAVFISVSPPILIEAVAGLALLGALGTSVVAAMSRERDREAAVITLLVTASGVTFFGVGGAFWGLVAGGAIYLWEHRGDGTEQGVVT
ncbi:MAG: benzoate/H(+) symporter BenE family transporter [Gammaproteobacteria bacterium]|nr:benzoate/H(+) symporter BenE family transporter [Gammaproteobacteria bacterium]